MRYFKENKTFFESPSIMKRTEGQKFIEDYGVDGERLYSEGEAYLYKRRDNGYHTKGLLRLFCKDCAEVQACKGSRWDTCLYRMYLLDSINKELARQDKESKKTIEK